MSFQRSESSAHHVAIPSPRAPRDESASGMRASRGSKAGIHATLVGWRRVTASLQARRSRSRSSRRARTVSLAQGSASPASRFSPPTSRKLTSESNAAAGRGTPRPSRDARSEEHTSELQSPCNLVCRLLLEKKKQDNSET